MTSSTKIKIHGFSKTIIDNDIIDDTIIALLIIVLLNPLILIFGDEVIYIV